MSQGLVRAAQALVVAMGAATAACFAARLAWWLELFCHFRVQAVIAGLVLGALLAALRRPRWMLAAVVLTAVHAAAIAPVFVAPPAASVQAEPRVRLLMLNVLTRNTEHAAVAELIAATDADVVGLIEPDARWLEALSAVTDARYPHRELVPRDDNLGVALYSRLPIVAVRVETFDGPGPTLVATLDAHGRPLTVYLTHTLPPVSARYAASRNRQLDAMARAIAARHDTEREAVVLMGDLNTTPWSPYFDDLLEVSGLRDSRKGFGVHPSWGPRLLALPIDHVLHGGALVTLERRVGPRVGSDHRPVIVELGWRALTPPR